MPRKNGSELGKAPMKVLAVARDVTSMDPVVRGIRRLNPAWRLDWSAPRATAALISEAHYDVVLLDWPSADEGTNTVELCRQWRATGYRGVVVVFTKRRTAQDRIRSLTAGAEDHIVRPSTPEEVSARLEVAVAMAKMRPRPRQCGPVRLDPDSLEIVLGHHRFAATKHQWLLMSALVRAAGAAVTFAELCRAAQIQPGHRFKNVRNEIGRLRRRFAGQVDAAELIASVPGIGYRLAV